MKGSGNTILITGGATGIGLALAEALLRSDNEVLICGRRRQKLQAARKKLPDLHVRVCDVTKSRSRFAVVEWATNRFESLNVLVNNAGIQRSVDFTRGQKDIPQAEAEVAVNLTAPIQLSALLIPHLRRQKQAAIVNISSGLAFTPLAAVPVYCATKAAIHSLSLSMRYQLRNTPIRVFEIAPPIVATELAGRRRRSEDPGSSMSAEEVARGILAALERDSYEVALGAAAHLYRERDTMFAALNQ
jgi:uncharacterized oxidoreductase